MIHHIWSVLCRKSSIDKDTNNVSMFDVFELLTVEAENNKDKPKEQNLISLPVEYELVSFWVKDIKELNTHIAGTIQIEIADTQGKIGKSFEQHFEIPEGMRRLRTRSRITGLVVSTSGTYTFKVSIRETEKQKFKLVSEVPLEVMINRK